MCHPYQWILKIASNLSCKSHYVLKRRAIKEEKNQQNTSRINPPTNQLILVEFTDKLIQFIKQMLCRIFHGLQMYNFILQIVKRIYLIKFIFVLQLF